MTDSGYVYFMEMRDPSGTDDGPAYIKVGFSTDPDRRRYGLQTGIPFDLEIIICRGVSTQFTMCLPRSIKRKLDCRTDAGSPPLANHTLQAGCEPHGGCYQAAPTPCDGPKTEI